MNEIFDDPRLKSAVKRVWSRDTAPPELRARIQSLFSESGGNLSIGMNLSASTRPRWISYAMAASLLFFAGLLTWLPGEKGFPQTIAQDMVNRHDLCKMAPDHHFLPGVANNDFTSVGSQLSGIIKVPVISTALKGWTFAGAGPCPIWAHATGHLLYRKGDETLSLFTIPAEDFSLGYTSGNYAVKISDHVLAGFLRGDALYCVVIESPGETISIERAQRLRNELENDFRNISFSAPAVARGPFHGMRVASR